MSVNCVPVTVTATVALEVPAEAVTVMVRLLWSPAVVSVAAAWPLLSLVPAVTPVWVVVGAIPPELAEKDTATPGSSLLLASRTTAVMVALVAPLDGICGALVVNPIVTWLDTTETVAVLDTEPDVAVIVIVVPAVTPDPDKVAVICPLAFVVAVAPERVPALAANVTGTLASALLFAS